MCGADVLAKTVLKVKEMHLDDKPININPLHNFVDVYLFSIFPSFIHDSQYLFFSMSYLSSLASTLSKALMLNMYPVT